MTTTVSIIIATRNRANDLRGTLASIAQLEIPHYVRPELVVVDNGSSDHTANVVASADLTNMPVCMVYEERPGQALAHNAGLHVAHGEIILITDDDVRVPRDWITQMCKPILSGTADAVAGGVVLAPHLRRLWMSRPEFFVMLATTETIDPEDPERMVGANMAFSRRVLEKVPGFDPELGPGALGFAGETLFSYQLRRAGFRLVSAFHAQVEHHCDSSRLSHASYVSTVKKLGRAKAYIDYHWLHRYGDQSRPSFHAYLAAARAFLSLAYRRAKHRRRLQMSEGMQKWEMHAILRLYRTLQLIKEQQRPRNYAQFGLKKRSGGGLLQEPDYEFSAARMYAGRFSEPMD